MKTGAKRNYTFYVLMLLIFGGLFWMVIREGKLWDRAFDKTHREAVEMVSGHVAVHQAPHVPRRSNSSRSRCTKGCTIR